MKALYLALAAAQCWHAARTDAFAGPLSGADVCARRGAARGGDGRFGREEQAREEEERRLSSMLEMQQAELRKIQARRLSPPPVEELCVS
jgi:hypothetical protein